MAPPAQWYGGRLLTPATGCEDAGVTDKTVEDQGQGDGYGDPDKSPRTTEVSKRPQRAEVSNYEIVNHYFSVAAERLGLRDDIAAVLRSSYREVQIQIPIT